MVDNVELKTPGIRVARVETLAIQHVLNASYPEYDSYPHVLVASSTEKTLNRLSNLTQQDGFERGNMYTVSDKTASLVPSSHISEGNDQEVNIQFRGDKRRNRGIIQHTHFGPLAPSGFDILISCVDQSIKEGIGARIEMIGAQNRNFLLLKTNQTQRERTPLDELPQKGASLERRYAGDFFDFYQDLVWEAVNKVADGTNEIDSITKHLQYQAMHYHPRENFFGYWARVLLSIEESRRKSIRFYTSNKDGIYQLVVNRKQLDAIVSSEVGRMINIAWYITHNFDYHELKQSTQPNLKRQLPNSVPQPLFPKA